MTCSFGYAPIKLSNDKVAGCVGCAGAASATSSNSVTGYESCTAPSPASISSTTVAHSTLTKTVCDS